MSAKSTVNTDREIVETLVQASCRLESDAALLAGAEEICRVENVGNDALSLVAAMLAQINERLEVQSRRLNNLAGELERSAS